MSKPQFITTSSSKQIYTNDILAQSGSRFLHCCTRGGDAVGPAGSAPPVDRVSLLTARPEAVGRDASSEVTTLVTHYEAHCFLRGALSRRNRKVNWSYVCRHCQRLRAGSRWVRHALCACASEREMLIGSHRDVKRSARSVNPACLRLSSRTGVLRPRTTSICFDTQ